MQSWNLTLSIFHNFSCVLFTYPVSKMKCVIGWVEQIWFLAWWHHWWVGTRCLLQDGPAAWPLSTADIIPWFRHIRLCWQVPPKWIFRPMEKIWRISSHFASHPQNSQKYPKGRFWTFFKTKEHIFCEIKLLVPHAHMHRIFQWCRPKNGHLSAERTIFFFLKSFFTPLTRQELLDMSKSLFGSCEACLRSKPNTAPLA